MSRKYFPVMQNTHDTVKFTTPVPWELVEAHNQQCIFNHSQTAERLAERGGLHPMELFAVLNDLRYDVAVERSGGYSERVVQALNGIIRRATPLVTAIKEERSKVANFRNLANRRKTECESLRKQLEAFERTARSAVPNLTNCCCCTTTMMYYGEEFKKLLAENK